MRTRFCLDCHETFTPGIVSIALRVVAGLLLCLLLLVMVISAEPLSGMRSGVFLYVFLLVVFSFVTFQQTHKRCRVCGSMRSIPATSKRAVAMSMSAVAPSRVPIANTTPATDERSVIAAIDAEDRARFQAARSR